jgi:hypothetical protein
MMTRTLIFLLLLPCVALAQEFIVMQEFFFVAQPPDNYFERLGIKTDHMIYEGEIRGANGSAKESLIRQAARLAAKRPLFRNMVQLDIEYLETDYRIVGRSQAVANAQALARFIGWAKNEHPGLKVGLYSQVPITDLYAHSSPFKKARWQEGNTVLQPLADTLDYLCPSIYCYYDDTTQYAGYARAIVSEAKRLAKGKKVYPFVSPQYHPSGDHVDKFVSKAYFARVLKTIKDSGADGCILWGGSKAMSSKVHSWDPNAGWWQATMEFMASPMSTH